MCIMVPVQHSSAIASLGMGRRELLIEQGIMWGIQAREGKYKHCHWRSQIQLTDGAEGTPLNPQLQSPGHIQRELAKKMFNGNCEHSRLIPWLAAESIQKLNRAKWGNSNKRLTCTCRWQKQLSSSSGSKALMVILLPDKPQTPPVRNHTHDTSINQEEWLCQYHQKEHTKQILQFWWQKKQKQKNTNYD